MGLDVLVAFHRPGLPRGRFLYQPGRPTEGLDFSREQLSWVGFFECVGNDIFVQPPPSFPSEEMSLEIRKQEDRCDFSYRLEYSGCMNKYSHGRVNEHGLFFDFTAYSLMVVRSSYHFLGGLSSYALTLAQSMPLLGLPLFNSASKLVA